MLSQYGIAINCMIWQRIIKTIYVSRVNHSQLVLSHKIGRKQKTLYSLKFINRQLLFYDVDELIYRIGKTIIYLNRIYLLLGHTGNEVQYASSQSL